MVGTRPQVKQKDGLKGGGTMNFVFRTIHKILIDQFQNLKRGSVFITNGLHDDVRNTVEEFQA